jgi:AhpC/TSA family
MKQFLPAVAAILILGCRPQSERMDSPIPTGSAPAPAAVSHDRENWTLVDIRGQEFRPFDESDVKAVVLVFVLQDCPIANSYMPELNRLHDSFASRGVQLIVVESDPQITLESARKHADEYQIRLPVVVDADHRWVKFAMAKRTPEAVVFSPRGEILYRGRIDDQYVGFGKRRMEVTTHDLNDALEAVLNDRPVPNPVTEAIGCYIPDLTREGK